MLLEPLNEDQLKNAMKSAGYTRKQLDADVEHLKEWLKSQHHLPPSRLNEPDSFLEMFLTGCKGSMETVKRKMDNYYTNRRNLDNIYGKRDPTTSPYVDDKQVSYMSVLPKATKEGYRIVVVSLANPDPVKFNHTNSTKKLFNIYEMRMRLESICAGDISIYDAANVTSSHIVKLVPKVIRDAINNVQEIAPIRLKKIIFINSPKIIDVAINNLVKPFLKEKLKKRILVTSQGYEELYKHIDRDLLPKDYEGGLRKTLKEYDDAWTKQEHSLRDWFINDLSEFTDESKRIDKDGNLLNNTCFGPDGTFKKLLID